MMTTANDAYEVARRFTEAGVRQDVRYTIPADKMGQTTPFLSSFGSIGFQPHGISQDPYDSKRFAIGNYFSPAITFVQVIPHGDGSLELKRVGGVGRSMQPNEQRLRLFPEQLSDGSDGKRIQTLEFHPDRSYELLIARAGETDRLFRLIEVEDGEWFTLPKQLMLEGDHAPDHYIEDITTLDDELWVLRSRQDGTNSWVEGYDLKGRRIPAIPDNFMPPPSPWIEGITAQKGRLYYSTGNWNGLKVPAGIYCGPNDLVLPNFCANGMDFCGNGAMIALQYNDGAGPLGSPGYIFHVPPEMFQNVP